MTAKEAVLSLMARDPHNPTLKSLKKEGLLTEILQSGDIDLRQKRSIDRERDRDRKWGEGAVVGGAVKRIRSIASNNDRDDERDRRAGSMSSRSPAAKLLNSDKAEDVDRYWVRSVLYEHRVYNSSYY